MFLEQGAVGEAELANVVSRYGLEIRLAKTRLLKDEDD